MHHMLVGLHSPLYSEPGKVHSIIYLFRWVTFVPLSVLKVTWKVYEYEITHVIAMCAGGSPLPAVEPADRFPRNIIRTPRYWKACERGKLPTSLKTRRQDVPTNGVQGILATLNVAWQQCFEKYEPVLMGYLVSCRKLHGRSLIMFGSFWFHVDN
jgi:hypothetical protein